MKYSTSVAAPDSMTHKKRVWGNSIQKKVQTGMQSVMCLFRNITTLNIIDIVVQLLRAKESGESMHGSHIVYLVDRQ